MRDGNFASPSIFALFTLSLSPHHFHIIFFCPALIDSTDPGFLAQSLPLHLSRPFYAARAYCRVSIYAPIDSYSVIISPTQHGHDLDDSQVSEFFGREETRDSADVPSMSTKDESDASLNKVDDRHSPPLANRVSRQHENARISPRQATNAGSLLVASFGQSHTSLETFPTGRRPVIPRRN